MARLVGHEAISATSEVDEKKNVLRIESFLIM